MMTSMVQRNHDINNAAAAAALKSDGGDASTPLDHNLILIETRSVLFFNLFSTRFWNLLLALTEFC
jgi:hypothetical protein